MLSCSRRPGSPSYNLAYCGLGVEIGVLAQRTSALMTSISIVHLAIQWVRHEEILDLADLDGMDGPYAI